MTIMRNQPRNLINQLHSEIDRLFDSRAYLQDRDSDDTVAASDWAPAVDIKEEQDGFVIIADIPGVDPKDIEVHMENGILTIKGERDTQKKEVRAGYKRIERAYGSFFRRFSLPDTADAERIMAKSNHGVLTITIPKHERQQPRRISVDS